MTREMFKEVVADNTYGLFHAMVIWKAFEEYEAARQAGNGSLPPTIYVQQGDSTHGKDEAGREYYIKWVSGDELPTTNQ